jgi:hypothetical protein
MFAHAKNPAFDTGGVPIPGIATIPGKSAADPFVCQQLIKFRGRELATTKTGDTDPPACVVQRASLRNSDVRNDPVRHQALVIARRVDGEDIATP